MQRPAPARRSEARRRKAKTLPETGPAVPFGGGGRIQLEKENVMTKWNVMDNGDAADQMCGGVA